MCATCRWPLSCALLCVLLSRVIFLCTWHCYCVICLTCLLACATPCVCCSFLDVAHPLMASHIWRFVCVCVRACVASCCQAHTHTPRMCVRLDWQASFSRCPWMLAAVFHATLLYINATPALNASMQHTALPRAEGMCALHACASHILGACCVV